MSKLVGCYRKRPSKHTGCGSLASLIPKFPVSSTIYWVVKIIIPNICILFWTLLNYHTFNQLDYYAAIATTRSQMQTSNKTYSAFTVEWRKPNVAWCHGNINIQIGVHTGKHNNNVEIMRLTDNKLLNCLCGTVYRIHIFVMFLSYLPFEANIFYLFFFFFNCCRLLIMDTQWKGFVRDIICALPDWVPLPTQHLDIVWKAHTSLLNNPVYRMGEECHLWLPKYYNGPDFKSQTGRQSLCKKKRKKIDY